MNELTLHYAKTGEAIKEEVFLGVLTGGETHDIKLMVRNNIPYEITADFKITGDKDVQLTTKSLTLPGGSFRALPLKVTPSITRLTPIKFKLDVKYEFVVQ